MIPFSEIFFEILSKIASIMNWNNNYLKINRIIWVFLNWNKHAVSLPLGFLSGGS